MVDDLSNEVEKAVGGIDEFHAGSGVDLDDLHARLACVEDQAHATSEEHLTVRPGDDERLTVDAGLTEAQIIEPRHGHA